MERGPTPYITTIHIYAPAYEKDQMNHGDVPSLGLGGGNVREMRSRVHGIAGLGCLPGMRSEAW